MTIVITAASHPHLRQAFEDIDRDGGRHLIGTVYPGEPADFSRYDVPLPWSRHVDAAEAALERLRACGQDDWETFVTGDQDEAEVIADRQGDLAGAQMLLNAKFDGWAVDDAEAVP